MRRLVAWLAEVVRTRRAAAPEAESAQSWAAGAVRWLTLGLTAALSLAAIHNGLVGRWLAVSAIGCELVLVRLVALHNRRGSTERAARLLALSLPLCATALMLAGNGMRDAAALILPASLVVCGLLLDRRTLIGVAALTTSCAVLVIAAEARGLVRPQQAATGWRQSLDAALIIALTTLAVGLISDRLRRSYARLQRDEQALRASEERYRALVDLAAEAILICGGDGTVHEVNARASEVTGFGRSELVGRPLGSLFASAPARAPAPPPADDRRALAAGEQRLLKSDGSTLPVEASRRQMPDGSEQWILRDMSERQRAEAERLALEARLRQAQKMEAIGRLAGGVAHDFNNLLTAITGSLTLAMRDVPGDSGAVRWLAEIDAAAWRAASLVRQLLAFSRKQAISLSVVDLASLVEGARPMLARLIGEDVELRARVRDEACLALVDQGQIEQVLMNLVANARDAMPDGGLLKIEVGLKRIAEAYVLSHPEARAGLHVVIAVEDSGHGMTEEVRSRVFEPFFTTKAAGAGTGLGLAMAYGAVQQNGGWIEVDSAPGRGTTFRLYLPAVEQAVPASAADAGADPALRGSEHVLLVEDEAQVREVTTAQLQALGYQVRAYGSGDAALRDPQTLEGPLDLLATDLVLPGLNGRELARRLAEARPGLKVLFISGYGEEALARQGVRAPGQLLLEKPFTLAALGRAVRSALDG